MLNFGDQKKKKNQAEKIWRCKLTVVINQKIIIITESSFASLHLFSLETSDPKSFEVDEKKSKLWFQAQRVALLDSTSAVA